MRVMVLVKATDDSEKGILPTTEMMEAMGHGRGGCLGEAVPQSHAWTERDRNPAVVRDG